MFPDGYSLVKLFIDNSRIRNGMNSINSYASAALLFFPL